MTHRKLHSRLLAVLHHAAAACWLVFHVEKLKQKIKEEKD